MPIRTSVQRVAVTVTAEAAGNYAAADIISNSDTADAGVAAEFDIGSNSAIVQSVAMRCSEDLVAFRPRLHLFDSEPLAADVEMDDNAAFSIKTATGSAQYLGYIDLPAFSDRGVIPASTQVQGVNFPVILNGHSIWVVIETLDAETGEVASMTLDIELYVI